MGNISGWLRIEILSLKTTTLIQFNSIQTSAWFLQTTTTTHHLPITAAMAWAFTQMGSLLGGGRSKSFKTVLPFLQVKMVLNPHPVHHHLEHHWSFNWTMATSWVLDIISLANRYDFTQKFSKIPTWRLDTEDKWPTPIWFHGRLVLMWNLVGNKTCMLQLAPKTLKVTLTHKFIMWTFTTRVHQLQTEHLCTKCRIETFNHLLQTINPLQFRWTKTSLWFGPVIHMTPLNLATDLIALLCNTTRAQKAIGFCKYFLMALERLVGLVNKLVPPALWKCWLSLSL